MLASAPGTAARCRETGAVAKDEAAMATGCWIEREPARAVPRQRPGDVSEVGFDVALGHGQGVSQFPGCISLERNEIPDLLPAGLRRPVHVSL
jgi:hypothetical protein